jgi:lysyl-tRNA synthetase class 2
MPLDDIREARLQKLDTILKSGIEAYPAKSWRTHTIGEALAQFDDLAESRKYIVLTGRIRARREHGGSAFFNIEDGYGSIQLLSKKDKIGDSEYDFLIANIDIGDFMEVNGALFTTQRGEKTLEVEQYRILSKSLLPLPDKWHGLQDVENRYRKRYLDLLFNKDIRAKFVIRAKVIQAFRDFLNQHDFLEVSTPTLQPLYGGASARPFKTHMHALDIDLFLRIAPELYLKRLIVGGFERVFEFSTNFRNEGMDRDHNPEFSVLEYYIAYKDHEWLMDFTEKMLAFVLTKALGTTTVTYEERNIDFATPFTRIRYNEVFKEYLNLDYEDNDQADFVAKAQEQGISVDTKTTKAMVADDLFKKIILPKLINPTFITDYPTEVLPLAKKTKNPNFVGSFQFFVGGLELMKAFTELNDPIDQKARFTAQEDNRAKGDEEAQRMDEDFIEALEYGMPPTAGLGIGLDRFIAFLTGSHSIREIILFPLMKPKTSEEADN